MKLRKTEYIPFNSRWKSCFPLEDYYMYILKNPKLSSSKICRTLFSILQLAVPWCWALFTSTGRAASTSTPCFFHLVLSALPLLLTCAPLRSARTARLTLEAPPGDPHSLYSVGHSFPHQSQGRNSKLRWSFLSPFYPPSPSQFTQ